MTKPSTTTVPFNECLHCFLLAAINAWGHANGGLGTRERLPIKALGYTLAHFTVIHNYMIKNDNITKDNLLQMVSEAWVRFDGKDPFVGENFDQTKH